MKKILIFAFLVLSAITWAEEFDCERKTCKAISSCEEAMHKLNECGHKSLDRDNDKVPCESLCGGG